MTSEPDSSTPITPASPRRGALNAERWRRIVGLVEVALDLERPVRGAYLEAVTRRDPELRRQVHRMLRHFGIDGWLEVQTPPQEGSGPHQALDAERIGPYRLLKVLGRGGMGVVYLAERRDQEFERQVAVKVIGAGQDAPIVHQRFLSERQILARFDHPNIARLFEGGTTIDGRPFFVLEYIDGLPLDAHCEERRLTVEQRLHLFLDVCSAVAYAHQNLVVHRDLKPSNILVDREGKPKLLDFGIAKLLDPSAMPFAIEPTRTTMRPMTPSYAAPEQVAGARITTATDVYSLGVLLFKLLTGRLPYELAGQLSTEQMTSLQRQDPPRPSQLLAAAGHAGMPPATWAGQDLGRIARTLRGDLDNIVLKALRFEPEQRYTSVGKLADDLRRFEQGEPVTATRDTPIYSLKKFVRKYRWVVAATVLSLLALTGFSIASQRQANALARERDKAEDSARDARLTRDFLAGLLQVADETSRQDNRVPLDALLDQGFQRLESGAVSNAAARVELFQVLAQSYQSLRDFRQAGRAWQRAAALAEEQGRPSEEIYRLHMAAASALHIAAEFLEVFPELESAKRHATGEGRLQLDLALLELDLHLDRVGSFRRRANALLAEMPEKPADGRLWMAIVGGYAYLRELQGHPEETMSIVHWLMEELGDQARDERFSSASVIAVSAMQMASIDLERMDEFWKITHRVSSAPNGVPAQERQHSGSLLNHSHRVQALVDRGQLDEAAREADEVHRELAKLLEVDPKDPRTRFVLAKILLLRGEIARRKNTGISPLEAAEALRIFEALHREVGTLRVDYFYFRALLLTDRREEARQLMDSLLARGFRETKFLALARNAGLEPEAPPLDWRLDFPPWLEQRIAQALAKG